MHTVWAIDDSDKLISLFGSIRDALGGWCWTADQPRPSFGLAEPSFLEYSIYCIDSSSLLALFSAQDRPAEFDLQLRSRIQHASRVACLRVARGSAFRVPMNR